MLRNGEREEESKGGRRKVDEEEKVIEMLEIEWKPSLGHNFQQPYNTQGK